MISRTQGAMQILFVAIPSVTDLLKLDMADKYETIYYLKHFLYLKKCFNNSLGIGKEFIHK